MVPSGAVALTYVVAGIAGVLVTCSGTALMLPQRVWPPGYGAELLTFGRNDDGELERRRSVSPRGAVIADVKRSCRHDPSFLKHHATVAARGLDGVVNFAKADKWLNKLSLGRMSAPIVRLGPDE